MNILNIRDALIEMTLRRIITGYLSCNKQETTRVTCDGIKEY